MSTDLSSASSAAFMRDMSAALRRDGFAAADHLIAAGRPARETILAAAELAMSERRWNHAAWLFDRVSHDGGTIGLKRILSRNLASFQKHRPFLYDLFVTLPKNDNVGIGASATGHATIVCRTLAGGNLALSPGNQPLSGVTAAMQPLRHVIDAGTCFALCGLGDGYLLHHLAQNPPKLYMDQQLGVFVLEPNPHIALTALMIHDYSGPNGPIEQPRFQWFIGPQWDKQLRHAIFADLMLSCPHISIALGLDADATQKALNAIVAELGAQDQRYRESTEVYYASLSSGELSAVFGENPPRRPRALFLTTRFSTVLQFATSDTADAFRQAGWETSTMIEPTAHHRLMTIATRRRLAEFKPDLVFQINHQRGEHPGMFPQGLPFVCWIQDHMEHLMTRDTGAKVGPNDFVMTDAGPLYAHNYDYPSNQLIPVGKLTTPPPRLPPPIKRGEDLVFVSNAAATSDALRANLLEKLAWSGREREFAGQCFDRIVSLHLAGRTIPTYRDVCDDLTEMFAEMSVNLGREQFLALAREINHPVCDALYRQQTLDWIVEAAGEMGLSLGLYGRGWENHPRFVAFARGPIAPGRSLHELTRTAAINFQIAPYFCLHQRLLDGICSGGFFLVREHLTDIAPQAMLDLLEENCPPNIATLPDARACVPPPVRDRFERLVKDCRRTLCSNGSEDPIEMVRAWQEAQLLVRGADVLPRLAEISFSNPVSLRDRIARFVNSPDLRDQISSEQRQSIISRLTYPATMRRVTRRIGQLLPGENSSPFTAIPIKLDIGKAA